jgi:flagellar basal body-associated protein FliL
VLRLVEKGDIMSSFPFPVPEAQEPARKRVDVRWVIIGITAIAVAVAVTLGLVFGFSASRFPVTARSIVSGDGYTVIKTLSPSETQAMLAQDKSESGQTAASMISGDAAAGVKGNQAEAAVRLTASGKAIMPALMAVAAASDPNIKMRISGDYLVVSGSASDLAGNPFGNLGNG